MTVSMLTTIDNPFDPFTDFDSWYAFDLNASLSSYDAATDQYLRRDCCSYVASMCITSDEVSFADQLSDVNDAVDRIVASNPLGIYIKVSKEI